MTYHKISIVSDNQGVGQIGGGAWLDDFSDWPLDLETKKAMIPLISFNNTFFPLQWFSPDQVVTIFIPQTSNGSFSPNYYRSISCNLNNWALECNRLRTKVIVHKKGKDELFNNNVTHFPVGYLDLQEMNEVESKEELEDIWNGNDLSKRLGRAHWLQDPINLGARYHFVAQFNEIDLRRFDTDYDGIFNDGMGYVFFDHRLKKANNNSEAGFFFIQYT